VLPEVQGCCGVLTDCEVSCSWTWKVEGEIWDDGTMNPEPILDTVNTKRVSAVQTSSASL
jgi:hypothetical protein